MLVLALAVCLTLTLFACPAGAAAADGVYEGTGQGRGGDVVMSVTMKDGKIVSVEAVSHNETAGISDAAFAKIPAAIVAHQSVAIDAVTGATLTSNAVLEAVGAAITAAGGDLAEYSKAGEKAEAGEKQSVTADVVVIGAGGAGLAAAITAAEAGASVAVIEKTAAAGGNTIVSGGYLNACDQARAAGMDFAPVEQYYALTEAPPKSERHAYWQETLKQELDEYLAGPKEHLFDSIAMHVLQTYDGGDYIGDLSLIESVCVKAPDAVTWLEGMGMEYDGGLYTVTGGLWARGHKAVKPSGTGYFEVFLNYIEEKQLPIDIYYETKAEHLVRENGKVTGALAVSVKDATPYEFIAAKNVVLATGGFGANVEMRERYNTKWASLDESVNTSEVAASTGDGITMALEIGAQLVGMEWIQLHPLLTPTGKKASAVCADTEHYMQVNLEGKRYVAEDARRDELSAAGLEQTNGEMWQISDINGVYAGIDAYVEQGYCYRGDTLEELAEKIGVPAENLVAAVGQYNRAVETGVDEAFGRTLLKYKIDTAPFYAGLCKPGVHHTMGGVKIDTECRVYDGAEAVIGGLFAAGEVTGGVHGSNRVGGNAIADIMVNGRIAGANAAK